MFKPGAYERSRDLRISVKGWVLIILIMLLCCGGVIL